MAPERRVVRIPAFATRAAVASASLNVEDRTVNLTFSTGADVPRWDWETGRRYLERLSLKPEHVRLGRLNSGAPLLDTHSGRSLANQLGVVEDDSARVNGREGTATVRFSKRSDVEPYFQDVRDRIIRNVSIGYDTYKYREIPAKSADELPVRVAVDWEPYEISMVPMPADAGAQTRDAEPGQLHECVIETGEDAEQEQRTMPETPNTPESIVEPNPLDPGAPITPSQTPAIRLAEPSDRDRGIEAERERVRLIREACSAARMSRELETELINSNLPIEKCQARVFEELRRRGYDDQGPQQVAVRDRSADGDPNVHQTEGIRDALLHRMNPGMFELTEKGRPYRGLSMLDVAKLHLQVRGFRVTNMTKNEIAERALEFRGVGLHSTSDFPFLLADVAAKTLRRAYDEAPQTWRPLASPLTLTNYRAVNVTQMGDAPELLEVLEHGEYKSGTTGEAREQVQLRKWGRKFGLTREALINDDLNAFSRIPANFGRKARARQNDLVWEQIVSNPTMGDGNPLFSVAHGNIAATDGAIDVTSLGAARAALRQQTSIDGEYLNLSARYLIVPPGLETLADQFVTVISPNTNENVNPFQGRLTVISDPRLAEDEWYVATGPEFEWLVYGYLEGEEGPQIETRNGFDIDGLEFKCRLDFTAKVIDWRGIYKNEGDT